MSECVCDWPGCSGTCHGTRLTDSGVRLAQAVLAFESGHVLESLAHDVLAAVATLDAARTPDRDALREAVREFEAAWRALPAFEAEQGFAEPVMVVERFLSRAARRLP